MSAECDRVCEFAVDVGMPEYADATRRKCGNCHHYEDPQPPTQRSEA